MASQDTQSQSSQAPVPALDRSKYTSPPPPPESMTPPPSSQALSHGARPPTARTPSPRSHLSSPPPTIKGPPSQSNGDMAALYTPEQIADASMDDLRNMLAETTAAYREARASAAHKTLQYNLLNMETSETVKRMAVELDMSQKEVEVLRRAGYSNSRIATPVMSNRALTESPADEHMLTNLRNRNHLLELEKDHLQRQLKNAKNLLVEREAILRDEIDRLKKRIRDNREHFRLLHPTRGVHDTTPISAFNSPQAVRQPASARSTGRHVNSTPKQHRTPGGGENSIATLLLADEALRNEAATSPSTPTGHKHAQRGPHYRAAQGLSSLPATPVQPSTAPPAAGRPNPYTPVYGSIAAQNPRTPQAVRSNLSQQTQHRRRESRDSTISASDISDREEEYSDEGSDNEVVGDDVPASQASQEAANLLRKSSSFRAANQGHDAQPTASAKGSGGVQSKIYGQVTKPGQSGNGLKRKMQYEDESPHVAKKGRLNDGVGLGIGWVSPGK